MTILFIYRSKKNKAFSIENVFDTVADNLEGKGFKIMKYYKEKSLLKTIMELRKMSPDHYHITGDIYYLAIFLPRKKTSMTVHDVGSYKNHKKTLKILLIGLIWFILPMLYIRKFTVISHFVKCDIKKFFKINQKKITVIHNPLTIKNDYNINQINIEKIKILQIGTGSHKNLGNLIDAVSDFDNFQLLIVGNPADNLLRKMKENNIDYIVYNNLTNPEVINIYKECDILYFASFSEGFGLPILEAQALCRPVITSFLEPMIEIGGTSVKFVNPFDVEEIKSSIIDLVYSSTEYTELVNKGLENIKRFDPAMIGEDYGKFFKSFNHA